MHPLNHQRSRETGNPKDSLGPIDVAMAALKQRRDPGIEAGSGHCLARLGRPLEAMPHFARAGELEPALARHGLYLRRDILDEDTRTLYGTLSSRAVTRRTSDVLDEADRVLTRLEKVLGG